MHRVTEVETSDFQEPRQAREQPDQPGSDVYSSIDVSMKDTDAS